VEDVAASHVDDVAALHVDDVAALHVDDVVALQFNIAGPVHVNPVDGRLLL
jgi:hypothetical protein